MALPLPQLDGKYEILQKLREGGMGAIYKVRHQLLDEVRVIKVMRPQLEEDQELGERFLREARNAIKVRHPNIAQLYDFSIDDAGTRYMVIEFIDGLSLQEVLRLEGSLNLSLAVEIAAQSLRALGYLHRRGFVHRDISPDNLMLTADHDLRPVVKLIDLGIAKSVNAQSGLTKADTFLGKVKYASPESFHKGSGAVDQRSDLYSFGIVFYELLTGTSPVRGSDLNTLIASHLFNPPVPFSESDPRGRVPEKVRAVVLKALEKRIETRLQSAEAFLTELLDADVPRRADELSAESQRILARRLEPQLGRHRARGPTQEGLDDVFPPEKGSGPSSLAPLLEEAEMLLARRALAEAQAKINEALEIDPASAPARALEQRVQQEQALVQRQSQARQLVSEARSLLRSGRLEEARQRAIQACSMEVDGTEASHALEEIEGALEQARLTHFLSEAHRLRAAGDAMAAIAQVDAALRIDPSSRELTDLRSALSTELEQQARDRGRRERLSEIAQSVSALLERRDWEAASGALRQAQDELGEAPELFPLWDALAEREQADRDQRFAREVEQARRELAAGQAEAASARLQAALELSPLDPAPANELMTRAGRELERQRLMREANAAREQLQAEVEAELGRGDVEKAGHLLEQAALKLGGGDTAVDHLRHRVEQVRAALSAAIAARAQARSMLDAGDAARAGEALQSVDRQLLPPVLVNELDILDAEVQERARAQRLAEWREAVADRLRLGDLTDARRALELAQQELGSDPLADLADTLDRAEAAGRRRTAEALVAEARQALREEGLELAVRKLREAVEADPQFDEATRELAQAESALTARRAQERRQQSLRQGVEEANSLRRSGKLAAAVKALDRLGTEHSAQDELRSLRDQISRELGELRSLRRRRLGLVAAGLAGVALVAVAVAWLLGGGGGGAKADGSLLVDAQPWAQVLSIVDEHGNTVMAAEDAFTPYRTSLSPGRYTVRLRGPGGAEEVSIEVQVRSRDLATGSHSFLSAPAAERAQTLLEQLGYSSP